MENQCEWLLEARSILEDGPHPKEVEVLLEELQQILEEHDHELALYEAGLTDELADTDGMDRKSIEIDIERIEETITFVKVVAGRVKEASLKIEKTYSVCMTFV
jgi:hypothetical protein